MSSVSFAPAESSRRPGRLRHYLRVLRVVAGVEFKLKYTDSALGYVWSVVKPLALFTILCVGLRPPLQAQQRLDTTRSLS